MYQFIFGRFPPLFLLTGAFISGIIWQITCYSLVLPCAVAAVLIFSCLPNDTHLTQRLTQNGLWVLVFFLIGALRTTSQEAYFLAQAQLLCNKKSTITGIVIEKEERPNTRFPLVLTIAVTNVSFRGQTSSPSKPLIKLYCHEEHNFEYNDILTIPDIYLSYPEDSSFGHFLKKQNICANGFLKKNQLILLVERPIIKTWNHWLQQQKDSLIAHFQKNLSPEAFTLFSAIALGYKMEKNEFTASLREKFQWWGMSFHLARAGLHLFMFMLALQLFLFLLPLPFIIKQSISMILIFMYALFSWTSISFIRAVLMVLCYFLCTVTAYASHALHTISLVCCLILLYNPFYLFSLDFQLSFAYTLGLALFRDAYLYRRAFFQNRALL